jgi:hypothetical protein
VYKYDGIIVLFNHEPQKLIPFILKLKKMGKKVVVGYHEGFDDFLLKASSNFEWLKQCKELVSHADAYWNVIPSANNVFISLFGKRVFGVLHAIPFKEWKHNITKPSEQREGILLATRTFNQTLRRNTLAALSIANLAAELLDTHVTFVSEFGQFPPWQFSKVKTIVGAFPYVGWLDLISKHRLVFHFDESHTLGQVVADAALVNVPCVGGNSENNIQTFTSYSLRGLERVIVDCYNKPILHGLIKEDIGFEPIANQVKECFLNL